MVKPKEVSLFDGNITYTKIDDSDTNRLIDDKIEEIRGFLGKNKGNKVSIKLSKVIKKKGWLGMVSEESIELEQWKFQLYITEYDKSISTEQRDIMLQKRLNQILELCDQYTDHLLNWHLEDSYDISIYINENSANSPLGDIFDLLKNGPPKFF